MSFRFGRSTTIMGEHTIYRDRMVTAENVGYMIYQALIYRIAFHRSVQCCKVTPPATVSIDLLGEKFLVGPYQKQDQNSLVSVSPSRSINAAFTKGALTPSATKFQSFHSGCIESSNCQKTILYT